MIFELQGELILDKNKKTIIFIDKGEHDSYTHIYGTSRVIKEKLSNQYNIVTIGAGCKLTNNYYEIKRKETKKLLRKVDHPDYLRINFETISKSMEESFKDLIDIEYIILGTDDMFRLPLFTYSSKKYSNELYNMKNEFFDYIGEDHETLEKIDELNDKVVSDFDRLCSPLAFSTQDYSLFMRLIDFMNRTNRLKKHVIGFSIDPAIYIPFFDKLNIKSKFYYFSDDNRGTRRFEKFDIAQFQHLVYDKKYCKLNDWNSNIEKTHNMFFAGTIFQSKGSRRFIFDQFLNDVNDEKSCYYIPLRKNGIIKNNTKVDQRKNELTQDNEFSELLNKVLNHKNFRGSLLPHDMNDTISKYKYGMIFRCVSVNDSLNFRPVLYASLDILPFFDYMYDPNYIQIPKEIQDILVVRNSDDIVQKIEFFNNNNNIKVQLLNKLRKLFKIDEYTADADGMVNRQISKIIPEFVYS